MTTSSAAIALTSPHDDLLKALNQRTDKLISVLSVLKSLLELRTQSRYCLKPEHKKNEPLDSFMAELLASINPRFLDDIKRELKEISCLQPEYETTNCGKWARLRVVQGDLNLIQERINSLFRHSIIPILVREKLASILVSKIKYADLKEEASVNCEIITELFHSVSQTVGIGECSTEDMAEKLNFELLKLDVLNNKANVVIGAMTMIEVRRLRIEELAEKDHQRRNRTTKMVTLYIILVTLAIVFTPILCLQHIKLQEIKFLNIIPVSVMVWSFIGSFAATIHRFNRTPIHYFNDVWKWMLTRHAQGIILSSAFYLVLTSGLFLIYGGTDATASNMQSAASNAQNETSSLQNGVVLILSFLIGFSDRFVDNVFNTLIERYTGGDKSTQADSKAESKS